MSQISGNWLEYIKVCRRAKWSLYLLLLSLTYCSRSRGYIQDPTSSGMSTTPALYLFQRGWCVKRKCFEKTNGEFHRNCTVVFWNGSVLYQVEHNDLHGLIKGNSWVFYSETRPTVPVITALFLSLLSTSSGKVIEEMSTDVWPSLDLVVIQFTNCIKIGPIEWNIVKQISPSLLSAKLRVRCHQCLWKRAASLRSRYYCWLLLLHNITHVPGSYNGDIIL